MPSVASYSAGSADPPTKCSACLKVTRSVTSFLLSHIGLLSLVVGYCIMGAFIFQEVEKYNEIETKRQMKDKRLAMTDQLWGITKGMEVLHQENWTTEVTTSLKKFEKQLIIALKEKGWDGKEEEDIVMWTFAGALFYSITVITTIGYGHIAPKTPVGKIVTIFYAIVGIPITVICWSNIGDAMAHAFRFCYWKICCYVYVKKTKKRRKRVLSRQRALSMRHPASITRGRSMRRSQRPSQRSADSKITTHTADSKLTSHTLDSKMTFQTQDSKVSDSGTSYSISDPERFEEHLDKDMSPNKVKSAKKSGNLFIEQEALKSNHTGQFLETPKQSPEAEFPPAIAQHEDKDNKEVKEKISAKDRWAKGKAILKGGERESQKSQHSAASGGSSGSPGPTVPAMAVPNMIPRGHQQRVARLPEDNWMDDQSYYEEYYYDESEDDGDDYSRKPVPILLSIILVVAYIIGGAFLFQMWEGWSFLDSSYFCFITLTTIGFGDLTPDQKNVDGEQRIALCSLYLLFGIAMIAMSFNLVQEEVINSVKSVGKMLGILKDNEDDEDY